MVSAIAPQTISFTAKWDASNSSLKNTLADKVSKVGLYLLHRLAIMLTLPATGFSDRTVRIAKEGFDSRISEGDYFQKKSIEITTPDGVKLKGSFLQTPGCDANAPVVIFSQPNAALSVGAVDDYDRTYPGAFEEMLDYAKREGKKCNFILFDYRECGESEGTAIMAKDLVVDGESMYQFARDELKVDPKDIHMMGFSFGGGVTARVKALHPECTGNYVNDRSFTSMIETVNVMFGRGIIAKIACGLLRLLGWESLNSAKALESLKGKTLITYHPRDEVIRDSAQLARSPAARGPNIQTLQLQGNREDRIRFHHGHPLGRFTQENGHKAIEEVGKFLFSEIESYSQEENPSYIRERAYEDLMIANIERAPEELKTIVYGYVAQHFQDGGYYATSGEDAFLGRNGLSLTREQKVEALQSLSAVAV